MKRLNKYITDAGYCSRREADAYISQGRVTVNGREAVLGDMVGDTDIVEVDGERVGRRKKNPVYIVCNKPVGVTCTSERSDKTNIIDFLGYKERIFPVGRLDKDSEGLIILTNDGDIVNRILRAGNNNPKEYIVTVDKPVTPAFLKQMSEGVRILGVTTKPCRIFPKNSTTFTVHLTQGLNRQIRRMCQVLGYKVVDLKRVKVMNISLGSLETGRWRYMTQEEVKEMHLLLAGSSGTEEASNEKKAFRARSNGQKGAGSFSQYRQKGKAGSGGKTGVPGRAGSPGNGDKPSVAKSGAKQKGGTAGTKPPEKSGSKPAAKGGPRQSGSKTAGRRTVKPR